MGATWAKAHGAPVWARGLSLFIFVHFMAIPHNLRAANFVSDARSAGRGSRVAGLSNPTVDEARSCRR